MVTIVASWDVQTCEAYVHMVLDSASYDTKSRIAMAEAKVNELESRFGDRPVEVVVANARSLEDFCKTDPRFYGAGHKEFT